MTAMVAISLYLIIFLLTLYDTPFNGDLRLQPIPFEVNERLFQIPDDPIKHLNQWQQKQSK